MGVSGTCMYVYTQALRRLNYSSLHGVAGPHRVPGATLCTVKSCLGFEFLLPHCGATLRTVKSCLGFEFLLPALLLRLWVCQFSQPCMPWAYTAAFLDLISAASMGRLSHTEYL